MTTLIEALAERGIRHKNLRYTAGTNSSIPCPNAAGKCGAKQPNDLCMSVKIDDDGKGAVWNCKRASCGGDSGSVRLKDGPDGFRRKEVKAYRRPTPVAEPTQSDKLLDWFWTHRGINADVVKKAGVYVTNHWFYSRGEEKEGRTMPCIAFPYYRDGELVNVKYRTADKRFMQEQGAEKIFYGLDSVKDYSWCIICEGEMDVLACHMAGIENVLSVPDGAPERVKDGPVDPDNDAKFEYVWNCIDVLEGMDRIILAVDADKPGRALEAELARRIGRDKCWRVRWPVAVGDVQIKDANDCLITMGVDALRECITDATPFPIEDLYSARDYLEDVLKIYRGEVAKGFSTGFKALDELFKFTFNGTLFITTGIPGHGKALALDTPVPTPTGWTTMGDINVGDTVYDERGLPCTVTAATEVMHDRPCFRVRFDDGTEIIADAEHQWETISEAARRSVQMQRQKRNGREETLARGTDQRHKMTFPSVVTTQHISETLTSYGKRNHHIALAGAVQGRHIDLPIAPYTMGCWLGDGRTMFGSIVAYDQEVKDGILNDGYRLSVQAQKHHHTILGIHGTLRTVGVLGNKHIPDIYLQASIEQRLQLLRGMMDTDGTCMKDRRCEFTTINPKLAADFHELVCSLGMKATMITGRAMLNGVDCGQKYRICFTTGIPVFTMARKLERQGVGKPSRTANRVIISCDPVPSVPVRCIQVDSPSHLFLVSKSFVATHNSEIWDQLVINLADQHMARTAYCSFENEPAEHLTKLLEKRLRMPFEGFPGGRARMGEGDLREGMKWLDKYLCFMETQSTSPSLEWILEKAKAAVQRYGIKLLVVDPWNRIEHQKPKNMSDTDYIAYALDKLQRFGKSHGVDVVLVAHPFKLRRTEEGAEPIPTPYDISGASHFFNMASICMTVWRDRNDISIPVQVHIQKVKHKRQGKEGIAEFVWNRSDGTYMDVVGSAT